MGRPAYGRQRRQSARDTVEAARLLYAAGPDAELASAALYLARAVDEPPPDWALNAPERMPRCEKGQRVIALCQRLFLATNNPMFASLAYRESRAIFVPTPEWVLDFLNDGLDVFFRRFAVSADGDAAKSFVKAFGIRASAWAGFREFQLKGKSWFVSAGHTAGVIMDRVKDDKAANETGAVEETAAALGMSSSEAWRARALGALQTCVSRS